MRIETLLNQCEKFKRFVYDKAYICSANGSKAIHIKVRPRTNSKPICSGCAQPAPGYDTLEQRQFETVPLWSFAVFLLYSMRRVNCKNCGVIVEHIPWASGKQTLTFAYMAFLARWAKMLSWQQTARCFNTSWKKVFAAVRYAVDYGLKHRDISGVQAIGVDEIAVKLGHHYLTVVYQIDAHCTRLLWIGKDRTISTLTSFFDTFGKPWTEQIKYVCSDMWKPYLNVIKAQAPKALHILDRFHIVATLNKAIDKVRAQEHRQIIRDGYEPVLKKSRWALLKRKENLSEKQEAKLRDLLKYNLKSVRAYLLKEDFNGLWNYVSAGWADKFLDRWCRRAMRSRIDPIKDFARSIRRHQPLILNWFKAKKAFSSGIVEGLNNKAKVVTKKSYGFRTYKCVEVALYHQLGNLPDPPLTHSF